MVSVAGTAWMLMPFPEPPPLIQHILNCLSVLRSGDKAAIEKLGDVEDVPRPWDPDSCDEQLRRVLWDWLGDVVAWLNHEYAWRPQQLVPNCWPAHPHIVRELAVLACLRANAAHALTPDGLEDFHRYALPGFTDRMTSRLGDGGGCRNQKHDPWPAANRYATYLGEEATEWRRRVFDADSGPRIRSVVGGR